MCVEAGGEEKERERRGERGVSGFWGVEIHVNVRVQGVSAYVCVCMCVHVCV